MISTRLDQTPTERIDPDDPDHPGGDMRASGTATSSNVSLWFVIGAAAAGILDGGTAWVVRVGGVMGTGRPEVAAGGRCGGAGAAGMGPMAGGALGAGTPEPGSRSTGPHATSA